MTEAQVTRELLTVLSRFQPGVYVKHCDSATIGVPDISATTLGQTSWLEIKLAKRADARLAKINIDPAQLTLMRQLELYGKRAWYVIFVNERRRWFMRDALPSTIARAIAADQTIEALGLTEGKNFQRVIQLIRTGGSE